MILIDNNHQPHCEGLFNIKGEYEKSNIAISLIPVHEYYHTTQI